MYCHYSINIFIYRILLVQHWHCCWADASYLFTFALSHHQQFIVVEKKFTVCEWKKVRQNVQIVVLIKTFRIIHFQCIFSGKAFWTFVLRLLIKRKNSSYETKKAPVHSSLAKKWRRWFIVLSKCKVISMDTFHCDRHNKARNSLKISEKSQRNCPPSADKTNARTWNCIGTKNTEFVLNFALTRNKAGKHLEKYFQ